MRDDNPILIVKRLQGIDAKVPKAVNVVIEKDVKKRIGIADFVRSLKQ